jgi:hypothetical protein
MLVMHLLSVTAMIQATYAMSTDFESMGYIEKMQVMGKSAPGWNNYLTGFMYVWMVASAITLAANQRKRAIHDFVAGTVVLRTD